MALSAELIPHGRHHAKTVGSITVGAGNGQVPALGANQLLKLPLPFDPSLYANDRAGFESQFYVLAKPLDANVTAISLDATQFEYPPGAPPNLRLRVDISAVPATVEIWLDAEYSASR